MERILVVDPDPASLERTRRRLTGEGFDVVCHSSGRDAYHSIERDRPDVLVQELVLPDLDGLDLLGQVTAVRPNLPVVIYTRSRYLQDNFLTWMADAFVVKGNGDTSDDLLLETLRRIVERRQRNAEKPRALVLVRQHGAA